MMVPFIVIDFLKHGMWFLMSAVAIIYAVRLFKLRDPKPALFLVLGALSLLFAQVFLILVPLPTISWGFTSGCCYTFSGFRQLGGYFSVELAPVLSSLFWLIAIVLRVRRPSA